MAEVIRAATGVTLRIDGPCGAGRGDRLLDTFPADVLAPMWAHLSLRMADWATRHFGPADVAHCLDFAEQRIR